MAEQAGHSTSTLLWATAGSALAGVVLGYKLASRQSGAAPRGRATPKLYYGARLTTDGGSADSTPAATPRALSRTDSARGPGLKMVLLVRGDLSKQELAEQCARTVLGLYKKQYKRRDPNLRGWEEGGYKLRVLAVAGQGDMLEHQAEARLRAIPTHTFAGSDRVNKQRTVMALGPAPAEQLDHITARLPELA